MTGVIEWLKKWWRIVAFIGGSILGIVVYKQLKAKIARVRANIGRPTKWRLIPDIETHIVAINPTTKEPETVELPDDIKASDVKTVGISDNEETYEIEILHTPVDRRGGSATGDLSITN